MKILDVHYPPITSYITNAPMLSIMANNDGYLPWLFHNHVQLKNSSGRLEYFYLDQNPYFACLFLDTQNISRDLASMYSENIVKFLNNCINHGFYIILFVNTRYISNYANYNLYDLPHPILIYGYDETRKHYNESHR